MLCGWLQCQQQNAIAFLREENRVLKARLEGKRLRLDDSERRRLAELGHRLGRRLLGDVATIVTPTPSYGGTANSSRVNGRTLPCVAGLEGCRPAFKHWSSGWPPRSDLGLYANPRCLEESGPPGRALDDCAHLEGGRHPTQPRTPHDVADVHAGALAGAPGGRFFHDRSVDPPGLLTYYTAFVIELHSRRVHVIGSTPHPDNAFVVQAFRGLAGDRDVLRAGRFLICDRDPKWSRAIEELLRAVGVRVVRTPASAPNCNAHAERFIRLIKTECLDRVVPLGERHLRRLVRDFVEHDHAERNHQGIGNELIEWPARQPTAALFADVRESGSA